MSKLKVYEIDAIENSIVEKIEESQRKKIIWDKKYDAINKHHSNLRKQIEKLEKKLKEYEEKIEADVDGSRFYINTFCGDKGKFITLKNPKYHSLSYDIKQKIRNEIIISNIQNGDIESLIDKLVEKYK